MAQLLVVQIALGSLQELEGPHFCDAFPRLGSRDNEKRRVAYIANIVPMRGSKVLRPAGSQQEPSHEQIKSYVIDTQHRTQAATQQLWRGKRNSKRQ
jgi:hypothetical protein